MHIIKYLQNEKEPIASFINTTQKWLLIFLDVRQNIYQVDHSEDNTLKNEEK